MEQDRANDLAPQETGNTDPPIVFSGTRDKNVVLPRKRQKNGAYREVDWKIGRRRFNNNLEKFNVIYIMKKTNLELIITILEQLTVEHKSSPEPVVMVIVFDKPVRHRARAKYFPGVAAA